MDPWGTLGAASALLSTDVSYSQVLAAKKALQFMAQNKDAVKPIVKLCLACSDNDVYTIKDLLNDSPKLLNTFDNKGLTPLIYSVCFHNKECVELLLTFNVDCNEPDTLIGWSPAMWATHLDYEDILERLVSYNADPTKKVGKSMKNALDLAKPGSKAYDFFKIHGFIKDKSRENSLSPNANDAFYQNDYNVVSSMNDLSIKQKPGENRFVDNEDVMFDENIDKVTFNFNLVQHKQYIKFTDNSIGPVLNYVFGLFKTHHTKPLYPSSIIFQCLRYAENKLENGSMVKNLMDLYLTRIRAITGTKSGVVQFFGIKERKELEKKKKKNKDTTPIPPPVDIVTIGYWISALNHLYYFLVRDTGCNFLSKYPELLQELISCLQSLISKLAFTVDARIEPFIDSCILDYNSVPNLEVMYTNEWKVFKNKNHKNKKSSYDEIIEMLYPPSYNEQMKPSPLKIIQTFGGLLYVLELFYISDIIKQQCFSSVLYYIGCELFNKVIYNKKYCSRVKAMEIRLNLSYIQDWLRTNNLQPFIEEDGDFNTVLSWKHDGFPDNLVGKDLGYLSNVCRYEGDLLNPLDATYYMNPLYKIGELSIQPIVELTEWLQILTGIRDLESLRDIIEKFEVLASSTMVQCIRNYHYEVNEKKFSKSLKKWLKENSHNENVVGLNERMFYKDDTKLVLNSTKVFPVILPRSVQLLHQYGADFKHVDNAKLMAYQPNIPLDIRDNVETIVDDNTSRDDDYDNEESREYSMGSESYRNDENYNEKSTDNESEEDLKQGDHHSNEENGNDSSYMIDNAWTSDTTSKNTGEETVHADNREKNSNTLFSDISEVPAMAPEKTWADDNPWA